jgi:hypothetical protein
MEEVQRYKVSPFRFYIYRYTSRNTRSCSGFYKKRRNSAEHNPHWDFAARNCKTPTQIVECQNARIAFQETGACDPKQCRRIIFMGASLYFCVRVARRRWAVAMQRGRFLFGQF